MYPTVVFYLVIRRYTLDYCISASEMSLVFPVIERAGRPGNISFARPEPSFSIEEVDVGESEKNTPESTAV